MEKAGGEGKVIKGGDMKLSVGNTAKKFFTDQLVGAPVNTVLYLAAMGWFKGFRGWEGVGGYVSEVSLPRVTKLWLREEEGGEGIEVIYSALMVS